MININNASFITSAASKSQFIVTEKPIIAVCGRSNVGKSSFINMLAGQKKLAKTSQEPGRTRLVNYFDFGLFVLADLPGYGYARVSKAEKAKLEKLLDDFFEKGPKLTHVFALCDCRRNPTEDDKLMINYLYVKVIPFTVVATKADKLSRTQLSKSLTEIAAQYKCGRGDIIATSAQTKQGLEEILLRIENIITIRNQTL